LAFADTVIGLEANGAGLHRSIKFETRDFKEPVMLTPLQKANVLGKAGVKIPACPDRRAAELAAELAADLRAGAGSETAMMNWIRAIEVLFATYAAARAAKSLREAEEARSMVMLRQLSARSWSEAA
jgi:hypothetical protein